MSVRAPLELPADGSAVIGSDTTILTHHQDTLTRGDCCELARALALLLSETRQERSSVGHHLDGVIAAVATEL
jgi:hypothetical protein